MSENTVGFFHKLIKNSLFPFYDPNEIKNFSYFIFENLMGFTRTDMIIKQDQMVSPEHQKQIISFIDRLKQHEPIQYILGETEFMGHTFKVSPSVLIPRPETEELVDWISKEARGDESILDIGTGSGCIPISLKAILPETTIFAWDISEAALTTAQQNATNNRTEITFEKVDILSQAQWPNHSFDIIISNPPYIRELEKKLMHPNVLNNEPASALFVPDTEPLIFYETITKYAQNHLSENGWLYFEINEAFGSQTLDLLKTYHFTHCELRKDLFGKDRMVRAQK